MERHYAALSKEMKKANSNDTVINTYLNMEFEARQQKIKSMPAEQRHIQLFKEYPCFKNHVEVRFYFTKYCKYCNCRF